MAAKHESDTLNTGYCEYMTTVSATPKVIAARALIIIFALVLIVAMLVLTLNTIPVVSFMLSAIIIFMAWFVFQFTKIEYEYILATGKFTLSKIYGARTRKDILSFKTSDITLITPEAQLKSIKADRILYTCKSSDVNIICIVYTNKTSDKNVLVISAPDKTIACLKYYRRAAFSNF